MKRFFLIGSTLMTLQAAIIATPLILQPQPVQAAPAAATKEVSIDSSGYVRDYGSIIGQIDSSGYVRDAYGSIIGKIDSSGYVRDASDAIIGQVDSSGYIRDGYGSIVAQFDSSGYLRDGNGNLISNSPVDHDLALFLIFFQ